MSKLLLKTKNELLVRGYTKRTIDQYIMYIKEFISFLENNKISIENLKEENVLEFLAHKKNNNMKNTSLGMVYAALHFLIKDVLHSLEIDNIKIPKKEKYLPVVLTRKEVKLLFNSTKTKRNKLIIELLYSSGLRVSELCNLKLENIDLNEKLINVKSGKGQKDRFVIISDKWLEEYIKFAKRFFKKVPRKYVFCKKNGKPLSPDTIQKIVKDASKNAGIKKHITPHTLRHSFATHLLESGENIRKIQTLLGHASLATTQIYTKISTKDIKNTKNPLDNL